MKSKLTVTIGIPVFNEELNIANLIRSILGQRQDNVTLEKVIVNSDGSTDSTVSIVSQLSKKNRLIELKQNSKREGKKKRLIQLYKLNKSDIIIIFDGDTVLKNNFVLHRMIEKFKDVNVALVSADNQPVQARGFEARILHTLFLVWAEARKKYNAGNNIYNSKGSAIALRKKFAKSVFYKNKLVSEGQYLYFLAKQHNMEFRFANKAITLFRLPRTFQEYCVQASRAKNSKKQFAQAFGNWVYSSYHIPVKYKVQAALKMLFSSPIYTILSLAFHICRPYLISKKSSINKKGIWKTIQSSKEEIYVTS